MWGGESESEREREREREENDDGEEDARGENGKERAQACVWQERTRRSRGGLICCCSGSPGAVWLFWEQVSWGERPPGGRCADPSRPRGQSTWSRLFLLPLRQFWHTRILSAHSYLLYPPPPFFSVAYWLKTGGGREHHVPPAAENYAWRMWFSVAGVVGRKSLG